jgi:predicted nucleic acid-binding protein
MLAEWRVFLDTSALFSGIWSAEGGARLILKLGETGAIQIISGRHVLAEIESVMQRKAPHLKADLAILLDRLDLEIVSVVDPIKLARFQSLITHPADAVVLAEAWTAGVSYFVTLDKEHFLNSIDLGVHIPFPIGLPGTFLSWYRNELERRMGYL